MKKTTKKLLTIMCSFAATACLSVGGMFAFSQTTQAQADATVAAELADFDIEGVGAIHNHFDNGSFYQLTLDFTQDALAWNQHASAVSGITFNGVPMTCGGAPSGDSIMVITLGSGLWIHYTAEQSVSGYKGYSHPTIHFAEGATVTDANGVTMTYAELTLYLVNGAWTTTCPEDYGTIDNVNYTPDFVSIGEINHLYNEGLLAFGVSLIYNTTGFAAEDTQVVGSSATGFSLNGEEIGVALWGGNQVLFWLAADKCVSDYNGYSHPTLVIAEGAKVMNVAGKEFALDGVTLYLVDGAWTTQQPEGYHVEKPNATFVDFDVEGVGATHNHLFNDLFYQLTLDFDQSGLAFNQHASAVSGITFNGVPMSCGGVPSDDAIMVLTLNSGLWIHYTAEQSEAYYKGYSHPTIHFEDGATVTDANGNTMKYAELTLYLVDGAWTTTQPDGYEVKDITNYSPDFISIGDLNHVYSEGLNAYGVTLVYDTTGFEKEGESVAPSSVSFSLNGEDIGVALRGGSQVLLWLEAAKCVSGFNGYSHPTLVVADGAKVTNTAGKEFTLGGVTLYLVDGAWTTTQPDGYHFEKPKAVFVDFVVDNVGSERNHFYNENYYEVSLDFNQSGLAFNQHASAVSGITYNGMPMTCGGAPSGDAIMVITLNSGLWIHYTAEQAATGYKGYSHPTIHFEDGATVTDVNGDTMKYTELTLYLVDGAWTTVQPEGYEIQEPEPLPELPYNGIATNWNSSIFSGVSNTILCFGEQIRDENDALVKCDFLGPDNGTENHADHTNWANPALNAPIATALTIDGKTISELYMVDNNVQVSYAHGYNYFFIAIPEYMLVKDGYGCVTLHIEDKTTFLGCILPEVTLYFYEGEWTSIKPDIVESEEAEYTTVSELFGEETKNLSGAASVESATSASGSVIYNFLLKNDSIENTIIFSTHYTTEFDGIKVVFMGDSATGSENILLFVNGREIASASYMWTENEWFTVRIAVDVEEKLAVSVAIDGVYFIKANDIAKDGLGTKIGVQNEKGNNAIADYRVGDIKKPILYWQGEAEYRYEVNTAQPADSEFQALIDVTDNKDGVMDASIVQVLWQDGAVTDGKLNEGTWIVTLSISDLAGNIAQQKIMIVVEDPNKVTVTFDGVATDKSYYIGDLLAEPESPVREGYIFEGWYFANDVLTGDLALTAKFVAEDKPITPPDDSTNSGDSSASDSQSGSDVDIGGDNSTNDSQSSSGVDTSDNGGCSGVVSFSGMGLTLLFASAAMLLTKKKKD